MGKKGTPKEWKGTEEGKKKLECGYIGTGRYGMRKESGKH